MGNKGGRAHPPSPTATAALERFQSNTGLMDVEAKQLSKVFETCSHGTGHVTREEFQTALGQLEAYGLAKFRNLPMGERLFDQFDVNKDGKVDLHEFMSGSDEDKLDCTHCDCSIQPDICTVTFRVFDADGNGYITKEELLEMYTSTYHVRDCCDAGLTTAEEYRANENARKFQDEGIEKQFKETMVSVTESIWHHMDHNKDGLLSKEEFRTFVLGNPFVKATYNVKIANNAEAATTQGNASSLTAQVLLSFLAEGMDEAVEEVLIESRKPEKKDEKKDEKQDRKDSKDEKREERKESQKEKEERKESKKERDDNKDDERELEKSIKTRDRELEKAQRGGSQKVRKESRDPAPLPVSTSGGDVDKQRKEAAEEKEQGGKRASKKDKEKLSPEKKP